MKKIKFLSDQIYESEGPGKGPKFEANSVHEFEDDFADRWLRRQVAKDVTAGAVDEGKAGDDLDGLTVKQLHAKAVELNFDLGAITRKDDILKALREEIAKRAAGENAGDDGLDASSDDDLLKIVDDEAVDIGEAADRDEIIAAIRDARKAKAE